MKTKIALKSAAAPLVLVSAAACFLAGCKGSEFKTPGSASPKAKSKVIVKKVLTPENTGRKAKPEVKEELDVIDKAYQASRNTVVSTGSPEEVAVRKVTAEIGKSLELGPVLVVWLLDRTASNYKLLSSATSGAKAWYESQEVKQMTLEKNKNLQSVVAGFDETLEYVQEEPEDDWQKVRDSFGKVEQTSAGKEMTFAAVKQVLDKFGTLHGADRQLVIVIVTNEVGDDAKLVDEVAPLVQRRAIPVYVVGSAAPWGQSKPFEEQARRGPRTSAKAAEKTEDKTDEKKVGEISQKSQDDNPVNGPESLYSERVNLPLPVAGFGFRGKPTEELIESGFGPFALERLCRAGGGAFLPVRPSGGTVYGYGSVIFWPTGAEMRFDTPNLAKYAPDYVSEADYQRLLTENKARAALHEAAKIGKAEILDNPNTQFQKGDSEAQLKRRLDEAQQASARVAPQIDRLYEALVPGEGDRDKLTSPRWQAQFDYAFGRTLAAKVRNDSYNQMIASLKAGKGPKDAAEYNLEQADSYESSSVLKKMADKAKLYLERVVKDHPGTPWAKMAAEDLKAPIGWKWQGT
ncbi:MAG: VWA domain-containing protein [Pirellulaceae bacterium]|nr:VWA domain-containing protein [Pirellulaceae bacterium]